LKRRVKPRKKLKLLSLALKTTGGCRNSSRIILKVYKKVEGYYLSNSETKVAAIRQGAYPNRGEGVVGRVVGFHEG
jgi:hypothetical protein